MRQCRGICADRAGSGRRDGLESVKKTHQVAGVGPPPPRSGSGPTTSTRHPLFRTCNQTWVTRLGFKPDLDMSLTMAQGMKRLGMPVAALFGVALIGLIGTSWFLNRDALRQAVEAQIRAVTGLDLVVKGSIDVSVFPGSYVSFHDVGLKGGGDDRPRARRRRADREFAVAAAVAAAIRDLGRHDAAPAYPRRPRRPMAKATGRRSSTPSRAP